MGEKHNITLSKRIAGFLKSNPTLVVAAVAAAGSMLFVAPDAGYRDYFDWHTLLCLLSMLTVLCAFRGIGVFRTIAQAAVKKFKTVRSATIVLVMVTFVGSMFLTNDMALLTFLPLTATVLSSCRRADRILFTFVMQTLAANLGGMILPFGNPQNLFLFSYFHIGLADFVQTLAPAFIVSLVLILACCLLVKPEPLELGIADTFEIKKGRFALYVLLFAAVIGMVFNFIPMVAGAVAVVAIVLVADWRAVAHVDFALLLTFCCFFVFSGNLARIPAVQEALGSLLANGAFLPSMLASQVISNVPSAVLLAPFTADWQGLLMGVDIGGAGTVVASLASLITMAEYQKCIPGQQGRFLKVFSAYNFGFLAVLTALALGLQALA